MDKFVNLAIRVNSRIAVTAVYYLRQIGRKAAAVRFENYDFCFTISQSGDDLLFDRDHAAETALITVRLRQKFTAMINYGWILKSGLWI